MRPGVQALEAHQRTLFGHLKNEFFSRNLGQNDVRRHLYVLEKRTKDFKIAAAPIGVPFPNPIRLWRLETPLPDSHIVTPT